MNALPKITTAKSLVGSFFAVALIAWTMTITPSANAIFYDVSRSWSDPFGGSASLIGTIDVPLGSYTIMNKGPSPFTSVSLTLMVKDDTGFSSGPLHLDHADTSFISGTGQFLISATASSLIFDIANANSQNFAELDFLDSTHFNQNGYAIGSSFGTPHFQSGFFGDNFVFDSSISFPNVFGTAASVPDTGSTLAMLSISLLGLGLGFNRLSRGSTRLTG